MTFEEAINSNNNCIDKKYDSRGNIVYKLFSDYTELWIIYDHKNRPVYTCTKDKSGLHDYAVFYNKNGDVAFLRTTSDTYPYVSKDFDIDL